MNELKALFAKRFPGQKSDLKFQFLTMDSLSWASFLSEATAGFTPEQQNIFLHKIFLQHTFEDLDLEALSAIIHEVKES
ncbi:MAG: hypothetical protein ACJ76H_13000 [Bacteriovoracaceae bacterium]